MATEPDEYLLAGNNLQITFTPDTPGPPIAGIARQEGGHFENGKWVVTRYLAGDDSVVRYDLGAAADAGQSGSGVRLSAPERGIQRVSSTTGIGRVRDRGNLTSAPGLLHTR